MAGRHARPKHHPPGRRVAVLGATALVAGLAPALLMAAPAMAAAPVSGAAFTTVNTNADGPNDNKELCLNGNGENNCNIYTSKDYVWLTGGPSTAALSDGTYFFAVIAPGGQADPNDGSSKLLSTDTRADRTFSITNGIISYTGGHTFDSNKIGLQPYADTPNPGGVYVMAICATGGTNAPVAPSTCKYDAFKVKSAGGVVETASAPTVVKDAAGAYTTTWTWGITKSVDATTVTKTAGDATFNYTVGVTHDSPVPKDITVKGKITVSNPNYDDSFNIVPVELKGVTDTLSDGTPCTVTVPDGGLVLTQYETSFDYTCSLNSLPQSTLNNVAAISWATQDVGGRPLTASDDSFTFQDVTFTEKRVDDSVAVTDAFNGATPPVALGSVKATDPSPTSFKYSRTVPIPSFGCTSYGNKAEFTTSTTSTTGSASKTVQACRKAPLTGARTMGFWQGPNGVKVITTPTAPLTSASAGCGGLATHLSGFAPFQGGITTTSTCTQINTYAQSVIKAANASGAAMNAMLKSQMLATALDTYFTKTSNSTVTSRAYVPATTSGLGAVTIDLKYICKVLAGSCSTAADFEDASPAFGFAASKTVADMLACASSQSNVGGSSWYGQNKVTQGFAKDAFDAVNNEKAFTTT